MQPLSRIVWVLSVLSAMGPIPTRADDRLQVVVSVQPQRWLVEQIGGDRVKVSVLVTPGESPATYQPTDAQVTRLLQAGIFFTIGVPFERGPWFGALRKMARLEVVDLRQGIELTGNDPHIWLSPELLATQAATVASGLSRHDPSGRDLYAANLQRLQSRLRSLDDRLRRDLAPFAGRPFFVFHPSWGYFARDYGLIQVAIEREGREPSDKELTILQIRAHEAGIRSIFVQPQIHGHSARAFAAAIGAKVEMLDPLAADVAANLLETAAKLKASFEMMEPHEN